MQTQRLVRGVFAAAVMVGACGFAGRAEAQYCAASSGVQCGALYEFISNVQLGGINNSSPCSAPSYEDYSAISTTLAAGQSMDISVTIGTPYALDECTVWVDWDNNGNFDDYEAVPLTFNPYPVFTGTISVPTGTAVGLKRMRVRLMYDTVPVPCGDSGPYGNIEDYSINVANADDPLVAGNPATGTVGSPILLTAVATPGHNPDSTTLHVTGDLSNIGGPSSQAFYDDGTHGDVNAGDGTFSYMYAVPHDPAQSTGLFAVPLTIVDNLNRSSAGSIGVTLASEPTGGCCTGGSCSVATNFNCAGGGGTWLGAGTNCQGGPNHNYSSDPNLAIPDYPGGPVSDTINVPDNFTVAQVTVRVTIPDHTYIGDLTVDLSNGSNTVRLWSRQCGGDNGLDVTFDDSGPPVVCAEPTIGTFAPFSPLSALLGGTAGGSWTLTVQDNAGVDVGTLTHWDINLHEPVSCGPVCGSADFNNDGDTATDQDIEDFFSCIAGNCCATCGSADFNGDGDTATDADIEAFFRVLAGGTC